MATCSKCGEKFKYSTMKSMFISPFYKLKCDKCNVRLKITKKTNRINSILTFTPLVFSGVFFSDILVFLTRFTQNDSVSYWLYIAIYTAWATIINNVNFPWTKYEQNN
ncbi:hypothetical protein [uncultured Clostridium sp.]|uniref:hypothetical protein n=1 Tax=uncultured Clostridium sp. TaxID=59620 RepID=UPI0025FF8C4E|nr:hypothetical protein [uncultured Clostridium sp.]